MKTKLFLLVLVIFFTPLAACGIPEVESHLVATRNLSAVINWNSIDKHTCVIEEGTEVIVLDTSMLSRGGPADTVPVIQVQTLDESCTAWDFPENFRAKP